MFHCDQCLTVFHVLFSGNETVSSGVLVSLFFSMRSVRSDVCVSSYESMEVDNVNWPAHRQEIGAS